MPDLYEVLGVANDASDDEIKRAYRRRARDLHPDAGGDEEQFKELTTAYEVLRNPEARANYDRYGDPRGPAGFGGGGDPFSGFGDLSDLIETFFGGFAGAPRGGGSRSRRQGGRDVLVEVVLTLEEAAAGLRRDIDVTVLRTCERCGGNGAQPGTTPERCPTCRGTGAVQQVTRSVFGQMLTTAPCTTCGGTGERIADPCDLCLGEGRQRTTETVSVDIPPGVDDGTRLRLSGRGEAGRHGGPTGDMYVQVRLEAHKLFERDGNDLHCQVRIPMVRAALGAELKLPTLEGEEPLRVPSGTQSGDVLTLRRHGMPKLSGGGARGDLHVHCRVETPTRLSGEQEDLLRRLGELRGETGDEVPHDHRGWLGRLRDAFS